MNILKSFDPRKTVKAPRKTLWAIASLLALSLLWLSSPPLAVFAKKHPGLIGVLIAVSGEVYFDWTEKIEKHAAFKRFFMGLLVVSLAYELYEASDTDKSAADAIEIAGHANERAANSEKKVQFLTQSNLLLAARLKDVDPLNSPINSVSAVLKMRVKGVEDVPLIAPGQGIFEVPTNQDEAVGWGAGGISFLSLIGTNQNKSIYSLSSDPNDIGILGSALVYGSNGWKGITIHFHENNFDELSEPDAFTASNHFELGKPVKEFKKVNGIVINLPEMKTNVFVVSGNVEVKVNGSRWTFPIPAQKSRWGLITSKIATNADNKVESQILRVPITDFVIPPRFTNRIYTGEEY